MENILESFLEELLLSQVLQDTTEGAHANNGILVWYTQEKGWVWNWGQFVTSRHAGMMYLQACSYLNSWNRKSDKSHAGDEPRTVILCDTIPWEIWTIVYSSQMVNWCQTKATVPPKSNLTNQWVYCGYLQKYKWRVNQRCISDTKPAASTKAYSGIGDDWWKLEPWSSRTTHRQMDRLLSFLFSYITLGWAELCISDKLWGLSETCEFTSGS